MENSADKKYCIWCGTEMHPPKERNRIHDWKRHKTCSHSCATSYMWHRCTKAEHEAKPHTEKTCLWCGKVLVKRDNEHQHNFKKRTMCSKVCAGYIKKGRPQAAKKKRQTLAEAAGVVTYKPGDSKFDELRRMYEGRENLQARGCRV